MAEHVETARTPERPHDAANSSALSLIFEDTDGAEYEDVLDGRVPPEPP